MTGISNLGQALDQISRLQTQQNTLDTLSTQISTGKKTQQFSGLGTDILRTQRARADVNELTQYSTNITNAQRRIQLINGSLDQIKSQANIVSNSLATTVQGGELPDFEVIQRTANDVYDFVLDLINTRDGDRFLFAGSDSQVRPIEDDGLFDSFLGGFVPDPDDRLANPPLQSSGFIGDFGDGTISAEEFIEIYSNTDENILGYSETLVSGNAGDVRVRVDDNSDFDYTVLGNNPALKDLVIALGVLKNLPPPSSAPGAANPDSTIPPDPTVVRPGVDAPPFPSEEQQENFFAVFNDIAQKIVRAVDDIEQEEFRLALVEAQTEVIQEQYTFQINAFQSTIAEIEDIDLTTAVAQIQQVQIGLEASFNVTALVSDLTLVNFLR